MKWEKLINKVFLVEIPKEKRKFLILTLPFKIYEVDYALNKKDLLNLAKRIKDKIKISEKTGVFTGYFSLDMVVTTFCNLQCTYCYARSKENKGLYGLKEAHMNKQTALKVISLAISLFEKEIKNEKERLNKAKFDLFITGGEPLLNKEVVKFIIIELNKKLNNLSEKYKIQIILEPEIATNGTLITEKFSKEMKKYDVQFAITLDGKEHDKRRVYANKKGSSEEVIRALKILIKNKNRIKLQSIVPITKSFNPKEIFEFYESKNLLNDIKRVHIIPQAEPIFDKYYNKKVNKNKENYERYGEKIFQASKKYNLDVKNYQERLIRSIKIGGLRYRCSAGQWKIASSPKGDLYPCHQLLNIKEFYMGNINDPDLNEKILKVKKIFSNRTVFSVDPCKDCLFQTICIPFVDCPARCFLETGNLKKVSSHYCDIHKPYMEKIFEKFLLREK